MRASVSLDTPPGLALAGIPLLAGLPTERLAALWDASRPERHAAGAVLRHEGEPAEALLLLLSGRVAASSVTAGGVVVRHGVWTGPCALDKTAVIDGRGHTATLTAESGLTLRALPRAAFLALVDDAAAVRAHVLRTLAGQAREQQQRIVSGVLPAQARLAAWLLRGADATGVVQLPDSQQQLAELLGLTRVTVNRALAALRRDGLITHDPRTGRVTLRAPELLHLRAAG